MKSYFLARLALGDIVCMLIARARAPARESDLARPRVAVTLGALNETHLKPS